MQRLSTGYQLLRIAAQDQRSATLYTFASAQLLLIGNLYLSGYSSDPNFSRSSALTAGNEEGGHRCASQSTQQACPAQLFRLPARGKLAESTSGHQPALHPACRTRAQAAGSHRLLIALPSMQGHLPLMQHVLAVLHKPPLAVLLACFAAAAALGAGWRGGG